MRLSIIICLLAGGFVLCTSLGIDRQVTLHLNGVGYSLAGLVGTLAAFLVGRVYWKESNYQSGWSELSGLRRASPVRWLARGAALVAFGAGVSAVGAWYLLRIAVPYLPGTLDAQSGVIADLYQVGARGRACNIYAKLTLDNGRHEEFCYERGVFEVQRIMGAPFKVGDRVTVTSVRNEIGTAILTVVLSGSLEKDFHQ